MLASIPASTLNQSRTDLGIATRFRLKSSRFRSRSVPSASARQRAGSVLQHRIEHLCRLSENPVLVASLGEGEGFLSGGENLLQRADRVREVRSPGDAVGAEPFDHFAEECLRAAL